MVARFGDGFDLYTTIDDANGHWTETTNTITVSTGRFGSGQALDLNNSESLTKGFGTGLATWVVGFAWKPVGTNASVLLKCQELTTVHVDVRSTAAGAITFTRNGTVLGTSTHTFAAGVWHHIQVKFTISDAAGTGTVRVDGQTEISVSGVDTKNGGTTGLVDTIILTNTASSIASFDDFFIWDTTGGTNNDIVTIGEPRFETLYATANGFQTDWTPSASTNNTNIDETTTNSDTDYNSTNTTNAIDLFTTGNLTGATGTVYLVQSRIFARRDNSGAHSIAWEIRQNSTNYVGTTTPITVSYTWVVDIKETDPDTAAAWTIAGVNSAEYGYKLIS
jgi:hypothetical protein